MNGLASMHEKEVFLHMNANRTHIHFPEPLVFLLVSIMLLLICVIKVTSSPPFSDMLHRLSPWIPTNIQKNSTSPPPPSQILLNLQCTFCYLYNLHMKMREYKCLESTKFCKFTYISSEYIYLRLTFLSFERKMQKDQCIFNLLIFNLTFLPQIEYMNILYVFICYSFDTLIIYFILHFTITPLRVLKML